MTDSKIIDKIRKLLNLADAERGGTEAERDLAMQRATELMQKHQIEMADLHDQSAPGPVEEDTIEVTGAMNQWQAGLYSSVGGTCFVQTVYWKMAKHRTKVSLIGRADNVAFVKLLCEHLIPWLEEEERTAVRAEKRRYAEADVFFNPRSFKRSFMESATYRIRGRLTELRRSSGISTDLVKHEGAANEEYMKKFGELRSTRRRGSGNASGHAHGRAAGDRADLSPGRKLGI